MAGFTLTATGTKGTIKFSSAIGSTTGSQANLAVGSPYNVTVTAPTFGGCGIWNVTKIVFTWLNGKGVIIKASDPDTGKPLTQFTFPQGMIEGASYVSPTYTSFPTTYTWNVVTPSSTAAVSFFMGIPLASYGQYQDTLQVHVYYDNGVDETTTFVVNMQMPQGTAPNNNTMHFALASGSSGWQFGPFVFLKIIDGHVVYQFSQVAWDDIAYGSGVSGTAYSLGAFTPGIAPWQTTCQVNNTTSCDGDFFLLQLGSLTNSEKQWYDPFKGDATLAYIDNTPNPDGGYIPYLDQDPNDLGPTQAPYAFQGTLTVTANNGPWALPAPNTVHDLNGNLVNYYYDGPTLAHNDIGLITSLGGLCTFAPYRLYYNFDIFTYLCFQPTGGIPIGMLVVHWTLNCTKDNAQAKLDRSWFSGRIVPGNWTGPTPLATIGSVTAGPYYVTWPYVLQYNIKNATPTYVTREAQAPGNKAPNQGPMGVSPAIESMFGPRYPKPAIPGFGGIGGSGMN